MNYVLPNRKAFADSITRVFLKYRDDKSGGENRELFPYQKIIRDYLQIETPYRGVLVYHGLGSGKTCTSIAVAESLVSTQKVYVLTPASLRENYIGEIRKCGDPIYAFEQEWRMQALSADNREEAKKLGISDGYLDRTGKFYTTNPGGPPNFKNLPQTDQENIRKQIEDIINQRFTFINYNGISGSNIGRILPEDQPDQFENAVVIVDEIHNLISRIVNASDIARKLYDKLYHSKRVKIVALSGTPVINRPHEISYLMNLLRGPIERITIPFKSVPTWDEEKMKSVLRGIPDVDNIEFNATKKYVMLTRNPPNFRSVYNEAGERIAVQYMKDMPYTEIARDWIGTFKTKFETEIGGGEINLDGIKTEELECLPTNFEEFANTFLDGLNIKNPLLFQRRIQGLVSYYKGADEKLLPRRVEDEKMLEKIPMSAEQFTRYLEVRWLEMQIDAKKRLNMDDDGGTYRVLSRLACNYAIPSELRAKADDENEEAKTEDNVPQKEDILKQLKANPERFLSKKALASFSPKILRMLENVEKTKGDGGEWKNQFVYSQYRSLEGLGVFAAVLDANGWQEYRIVKKNNQWVEDETMDSDKPAYAFYVGGDDEQREYMRQIFNGIYEDSMPPSLKQSVEARGKRLLCMMMASSAGAEGITLANVRHVHIMEPHWTPARHDQVIGRAIRINSHKSLPEEERTVKISFYFTIFSDEQTKTADAPNIVAIRRADTVLKRYEGDPPVETFMPTDEYLYEKSYEKDQINKRIGTLLKQSAVDCEIHRKLHAREKPVLTCMRFDSLVKGEDLAFKPSIKSDDIDVTYLRNTMRKKRRLQQVAIKGIKFLFDPDTKELFDDSAFDDRERLLRIGYVETGRIRFLLS